MVKKPEQELEKKNGCMFLIPKVTGKRGSNLETLQSRNGHAMKSGLKFYINTITALEIGLITLTVLLRSLYIKQYNKIKMICQSSPIYHNQ